jgi:hypothetical protein
LAGLSNLRENEGGIKDIHADPPSIPEHFTLDTAVPQRTREVHDILGFFSVETQDERSRVNFTQDGCISRVFSKKSVSLTRPLRDDVTE